MPILESINGPRDLRALNSRQLSELSDEIRAFLVRSVSRTGGHLGPNLGVVELTIALHRVFDSPHDPIVFDTGHQSYVHKMLTGRRSQFDTLRQKGGLSGYPEPAESEHDWVANSHASTALSWSAGLAEAFRLRGEDRTVVAVVGDGALTGGMAWEALNNISARDDLRLVIVVNDNGRSYTPTVGGLATHLAAMRTDPRYEKTLDLIRRGITAAPVVGRPVYDLMHGVKTGVKDMLAPQGLFSDLGLKYVGPVDGHDIGDLERALEAAHQFEGPVVVHCYTQKGKGFRAAEEHELDRFHAVGQIDAVTGEPVTASGRRTWTEAFSDAIIDLARADERVCAITAAMLHPTGLDRLKAELPERVFDVGIAEQHGVTFAAGLARGGFHPVFAVYSTFLNRAFDQLLMDVALQRLGVTFVLDRAGVTGPDGPSHNGQWDHALAGIVPGLWLAAPRDEPRLVEALARAVTIDDAPSVVRFSKEAVPAPRDAVARHGSVDVLASAPGARVLVVGYGQFAGLAVEVAERMGSHGIPATVVDPVWALPVSSDLLAECAAHDVVVTIEDAGVAGGLGAALALAARQGGLDVPVYPLGIAKRFLSQGSRGEVLADLGLTAQALAVEAVGIAARHLSAADDAEPSDEREGHEQRHHG